MFFVRIAATALLKLTALSGAVHAADGDLCGRPRAPISDLLIGMQKPAVEAVWRDKLMFMFHDTADSTYWVFTMRNTSAHPSVVCSRIVQDGGESRVESGHVCEANEQVCKSFMETAIAQIARVQSAAEK